MESFFFIIEHLPDIKIKAEDNLHDSLDHLAIQLLILKLPQYEFNKKYLKFAAENIAETLGPLSFSPWYKGIYEEFYDYLEENNWHDLFDNYFRKSSGITSIKGWRRTKYYWIKPKYYKSD